MDEKKVLKLKVIDKVDEIVEKQQSTKKVSHSNQTNPIYKNLAKFSNAKIGDKWTIRDLLR